MGTLLRTKSDNAQASARLFEYFEQVGRNRIEAFARWGVDRATGYTTEETLRREARAAREHLEKLQRAMELATQAEQDREEKAERRAGWAAERDADLETRRVKAREKKRRDH